MFYKYLLCFLVSMVPLIELRGAIPIAVGLGLDYFKALSVCVVGNMLPVPVIYLFARKVLLWGRDKKYIGKFFTFCIEKGEKGGQKLVAKTGRGGLFVALMLFVGIPLPGTGAWTGTLAASFLNMGFRSTTMSVSLGVVLAGIIMGIISLTGVHVFGL
ncbi:MAG: small multi-drug export protein [Oscillospiraceae bacterium]|nr:small multi-drug export protein [Oscillospiraceae bacterium]